MPFAREGVAEEKIFPPIHPGEPLREEFLKPLGITPYKLAQGIGVPGPRVYDIVREKRGIERFVN